MKHIHVQMHFRKKYIFQLYSGEKMMCCFLYILCYFVFLKLKDSEGIVSV